MPPAQASSPSQPVCKKTKWQPEEDRILLQGIQTFGCGKWTKIAKLLPGRNPKQCRERYIGQLDPSLNHNEWSFDEDNQLITLHKTFGNCWSKISNFMKGRSPNAAKNRFRFLAKNGLVPHIKNIEQPKPKPTEIAGNPIIFEQPSEPDFCFDYFSLDLIENDWI